MPTSESIGAHNGWLADSERHALENFEMHGKPADQAFAGLALEIIPTIRENLAKCFDAYDLTEAEQSATIARLIVIGLISQNMPKEADTQSTIVERLGMINTASMAMVTDPNLEKNVRMHPNQKDPDYGTDSTDT